MTNAIVTKECIYCWGTGLHPAFAGEGVEQNPCPKCGGDGRAELGQLEDVIDKCNDILVKCNDILDKCDDILEYVSS